MASLQALSIDWVTMAVLRSVLGVFEAAYGPGARLPFEDLVRVACL